MSVAGLTDVGRTREHNEDCYLVWNVAGGEFVAAGATEIVPHDQGVLIAVCDGMGGAAAGEKASALAVETLRDRAQSVAGADLADLEVAGDWLSDAVVEADRRILDAAEADSDMKGMGSTCTAVIVLPEGLTMAHVGDSRAYHLRDGTLRQISVDHSYVGQLVALGRISPEEARVHDQRNLLLQVLGLGRPLEVDRVQVDVDPDDWLLLCSDGLYDLVDDRELREELLRNTDPAGACRNLVDLANERGGRDNITVVVARIE
jgi:protein phosphatase